MKRIGLFFAMLTLLSACSVVAIRDYDPYYKNTQSLTNLNVSHSSVRVSSVSKWVTSILERNNMACRLTVFNMPAGKTVAVYIRDALTTELDAAKKLSPNGKPLEIVVARIESNTAGMSRGSWDLDFTYKTSAGSRRVTTKTEYESAFMADTACRNTAQALQDAVRQNFAAYFGQLHGS